MSPIHQRLKSPLFSISFWCPEEKSNEVNTSEEEHEPLNKRGNLKLPKQTHMVCACGGKRSSGIMNRMFPV